MAPALPVSGSQANPSPSVSSRCHQLTSGEARSGILGVQNRSDTVSGSTLNAGKDLSITATGKGNGPESG
ncbi:hypothetical protein, partial [Erwinia mallotivora]|uniref:hypothetical protein n=1 Tax=Erwinia mallotivora TaxID=69222 RepID=UPI001268A7F8